MRFADTPAGDHGFCLLSSRIVQILLKNGSKEIRLTPNSSGSIAESICGAGGDWYLSVEYADFSGSVTLCSRDTTQ